jgi:hypothetical protein
MLEINDGLLRGAVKPGVIFRKGEVAQLAVEDCENGEFTIKNAKLSFAMENSKIVYDKSNGSCPIGMVVKTFEDHGGFQVGIEVEFRRFSGETDVYDVSAHYPISAALYVSENGRLTTKKKSGIPNVGVVIESPGVSGGSLKFLWF